MLTKFFYTSFSVARVLCTLRFLRPRLKEFRSLAYYVRFGSSRSNCHSRQFFRALACCLVASAISIFLSSAHAAETKKVDVGESIPILDADNVVRSRQRIENPIHGTSDIFITKGGSTILDLGEFLDKEGLTQKDLKFQQTVIGPIVSAEKDEETNGLKIKAGDKAGYNQILFYEKIPPNDYGRLLKIYRVTVTDEDLLGPIQEVRSLLKDVEGLDIKIVGKNIVLDGKIIVPSDVPRIKSVEARYGKIILPLYELSPLAWKIIAEKMEDEIAGGKDKPKEIRVTARNGRFFLEGQVDRNVDRQQALLTCQAFLKKGYYYIDERLGAPIDKIELDKDNSDIGTCVVKIRLRPPAQDEPEQILAIRVDFVTLSREYSKFFNFNWSPGMGLNGNSQYSTDTGKFLTSFTATLTSLFPLLQTALTHGHARILKSATLLVRDGVTAQGGTPGATLSETLTFYLNKTTTSATGVTTTEPVPTDVRTNIGVTAKSVPGFDKINLDLNVQQAEVVSSSNSGGQPSINTNTISTSLVVGNGESAAIGGLITERRRVGIERDPKDTNGANFVLFDMSRKMDFFDQKSQFITFVTPTRMRTPAEGTESLKRKFRLRK